MIQRKMWSLWNDTNGMKAPCRKGINFSVRVTEHRNRLPREAVQSPLEIFKLTWIRSICSSMGLDWVISRSLLTTTRMWFWDIGKLQTWCKHSRVFSWPHSPFCFGFHLLINKGNYRNTFLLSLISCNHSCHRDVAGSFCEENVISGIASKWAAGWSRTWASII